MGIEYKKEKKADGSEVEVLVTESDVVAAALSKTSILGPDQFYALSDTSPYVILPSSSPNSFIIPTMITTVCVAQKKAYVKKKGGVPVFGWGIAKGVLDFDDTHLLDNTNDVKVDRPNPTGDPFPIMTQPFCLFVPAGVTYTDGDGILIITLRYDLIVL
jgi:hypothetical protein